MSAFANYLKIEKHEILLALELAVDSRTPGTHYDEVFILRRNVAIRENKYFGGTRNLNHLKY
jgi:hypothetical protein